MTVAPTLGMASRHQHEAVVALGAQRELQHLGMHVVAIDDEPAPAVGVAPAPRPPRRARATPSCDMALNRCVKPRRPARERRLQLVEGGVGVAGGHDDAGIG